MEIWGGCKLKGEGFWFRLAFYASGSSPQSSSCLHLFMGDAVISFVHRIVLDGAVFGTGLLSLGLAGHASHMRVPSTGTPSDRQPHGADRPRRSLPVVDPLPSPWLPACPLVLRNWHRGHVLQLRCMCIVCMGMDVKLQSTVGEIYSPFYNRRKVVHVQSAGSGTSTVLYILSRQWGRQGKRAEFN